MTTFIPPPPSELIAASRAHVCSNPRAGFVEDDDVRTAARDRKERVDVPLEVDLVVVPRDHQRRLAPIGEHLKHGVERLDGKATPHVPKVTEEHDPRIARLGLPAHDLKHLEARRKRLAGHVKVAEDLRK